jgi:hypothetical protein
MPERIFSEGIDLPDGRRIRVLAYDDWSIRVRLSHPDVDVPARYMLEEAFLQGGRNDHVILKLHPGFDIPDEPTYLRIDIVLERGEGGAALFDDIPVDSHDYLRRHVDRLLGEDVQRSIPVNVWRNDRNEIQIAYNDGTMPFRARVNKKAQSVARHDDLFVYLDDLLREEGL